MNRLMQLGVLVILLAATGFLVAESQVDEETRMEAGVVIEMDIAAKRAIIGGYEYAFAGRSGYDLPIVTMFGSKFGAFEMLQIGMKVNIKYVPSDDARIVVELNQLSDKTEIGDGGFLLSAEGDEP